MEAGTVAAAGTRNLITDVPGILVGQAEDRECVSGTTVVLAEEAAVAAVDVRGGAPGSRETELLAPETLLDRVDAVVLSGGSAFGLDAASGVVDWLAEAGRGFAVKSTARLPILVPIVPAAILFDLGFPGRRGWTGEPPFRALGRAAVTAASREFALGNAGAGLGATAGRLKGGIGSASLRLRGGQTVGAIVAVNSWGAAVRPDCGRFWTADLALTGEIDPQAALPDTPADPEDYSGCGADAAAANTTIAVVATDAALDKRGCRRLAIMAQDGLARAIRPAHTPFDGDTVFALSTGSGPVVPPADLLMLGSAAADCLARAIMRAVTAAEPLGGVAGWRQKWQSNPA
ncbi:MAG: P1 family peptidase [Stellaceae bacterium]